MNINRPTQAFPNQFSLSQTLPPGQTRPLRDPHLRLIEVAEVDEGRAAGEGEEGAEVVAEEEDQEGPLVVDS